MAEGEGDCCIPDAGREYIFFTLGLETCEINPKPPLW
jgi:hypothetical protein